MPADTTHSAQQERFEALVDRVGAIVYEATPAGPDGDAHFHFVSAGARDLLGYEPREWSRDPRFWLAIVADEDREMVLAQTEQAIRSGRTTPLEYRQVTATGQQVWVRNVVHPERRPDGTMRLTGVVVDMTATRQAQERLERVREAADRLSATSSPAEVAQTVAEQGRSAVNADAVAVFVREDDRLVPLGYDGHADVGLPEDCAVAVERPIPVATAVRDAEPVWVAEGELQTRFPDARPGRLLAGDGPLCVLPLLGPHGIAKGALAVLLPAGRVADQSDRTVLAVLARTAAQSLVRTRQLETEREARRSAEEANTLLDALITTAPEGYALFDRELRYAKVNQALADMNGRSVEEHLGRTVAEVIPDVPITDLLARVRDEGVSMVDLEVQGDNAAGVHYVWLVSYYPVYGASGAVDWVGAFVVDITQRKRAERRTAMLAELGAILEEGGTVETRLARVAETLIDGFADFATVYLRRPGGQLERIVSRHVDPDAQRLLEANPPSGGALLTPEIQRFDDISEDGYERIAADPAAKANHQAIGTRTVLTVPMLIRGRHVGVVGVTDRRRAAFDDADVGLVQDVAARAAMAVDNARLYAAERDARDRTERQYAVASALADALTPAEVADALLGELVPAIGADMGIVWRLNEAGTHLEQVGRRGVSAAQLAGHERPTLDDPAPTPTALRERRARWLSDPAAIALAYPEMGRLLARLDVGSIGVVPLLAAGRPVGGLWLAAKGEGAFGGEDQALAMTAAVQAAQAIERASMFDSTRRTSVTLQRSLLPTTLPEAPGIEVGLRYLPAAGLEAGGDFYEALPVGDDGAVIVAVGDVVGRGATAAASMGQLRSALRAFSQVLQQPGTVLRRLSDFAADVGGAMAATAVVATLRPATGELRYACAGHPWPLLVHPDGTAEFLLGGRGVPLGCVPDPGYEAATARLAPGTTLLLYTDGLSERRGTAVPVVMEQLRTAAAAAAGLPLEALLDAVVATMVDEDAGDDVALLGVRLTPAPTDRHLTYDADLRRVPEARHVVRAWLADLGVSGPAADDVLLAAGEAFANAVEHSGAGEVRLALTSPQPGTVAIDVEDSGTWRRPPEVTDRGRGLGMMRALVDEFNVDTGREGTRVRMRHTVQDGPALVPGALLDGCEVTLDGRVARLRGALDMTSAATVGARLQPLLEDGLTVDLTALDYLDSTGARLLLELTAAAGGGRLRIVAPPGGAARRTLDLSGLDGLLALRDAAE